MGLREGHWRTRPGGGRTWVRPHDVATRRSPAAADAAAAPDVGAPALADPFDEPDDAPGDVALAGCNPYGLDMVVTPGVIDERARVAYTHGQCHALALELHARTGWPLVAAGYDCEPGPTCDPWDTVCGCQVVHLAVRHPNGDVVDIDGACDEASFLDGHGFDMVEPLSDDDLDCLLYAWPVTDRRTARTFVDAVLAGDGTGHGAPAPDVRPNPLAADPGDVAAYERSAGYALMAEGGFRADEVVDLDPAAVVSSRPDVDEQRVRALAAVPHADPIRVVAWGGSLWVQDGDHRAVAAMRRGDVVRAEVMHLDPRPADRRA